jgi:hypothetical protein
MSGASATIASDALMNPFDGKRSDLQGNQMEGPTKPFQQSSNNECKSTDPFTRVSCNAPKPSTAPRVSRPSTSPTLPPSA